MASDKKYIKVDGKWVMSDNTGTINRSEQSHNNKVLRDNIITKDNKIGSNKIKAKVDGLKKRNQGQPTYESYEEYYDEKQEDELEKQELIKELSINAIILCSFIIFCVSCYSMLIINYPEFGIPHMVNSIDDTWKYSFLQFLFGYGEPCLPVP